MKKESKNWIAQFDSARRTMEAGEPAYYIDGKKFVEAKILKIDQTNRVFTALLRMGKHHLKWVSLDRVAYTIKTP